MIAILKKQEHLVELCNQISAIDGKERLEEALASTLQGLDLKGTMTRGGWHRLGGVVDGNHAPVASNLTKWVDETADGDLEELFFNYRDSGYFVTQLAGKSHYFTAATGDRPHQFVQIEVEELQEVIERPLIDRDWYPDNLEDFLDPLDYPRLDPEPVTPPFYRFRRIMEIDKLLDGQAEGTRNLSSLRRFFNDWGESSAGETGNFCRQWVLLLRDYQDTYGESRIDAKPITVLHGRLPELPDGEQLTGASLANAIHGYDRLAGYPFAWFFHMLSSKSSNYAVAEAVLRDQMGAYDYLPARDLKVLRRWEERPYSV
ncbi:MAG: hypothetical protein B6D72_02170 [gamma proteobacterium symbiont of Ctena orbiculata]|nr:MAG: hypothetical protein B6D72_02170 [gamma proteobacterium symbiont of Ctena orbiculata]PVV24399.1 MAG: hypothetical protein B6D74_05595 [gamma proteobacterium symbiont of Ctena orbiculata]